MKIDPILHERMVQVRLLLRKMIRELDDTFRDSKLKSDFSDLETLIINKEQTLKLLKKD